MQVGEFSINTKLFWSHVLKVEGGCWLWTASTRGSLSYGAVRVRKSGKRILESSHRVSWMIHFGTIPEGLQVLHDCDTPKCVHPEHLKTGTQLQNVSDEIARGRARNGNIKLNPEKWAEIRASTESSTILAKRYGIDPASARRIRRGKSGNVYRP